MGDSEEECDTWRNRDKYPKEREEVKAIKSQSPNESRVEPVMRNDKRSFNNYQSPNKSVEPPFKRQRREPMEDYNNFNTGFRDNRETRRETSYDNRFNNNMMGNMQKSNEDTPNFPTQPPMLLFKHFLQQQDDDIEMDIAMKKYNEYKESFVAKQLKAFFDSHNSQEWFREKYLPAFVAKKKTDVQANIQLRKDIFMYLLEGNWMDNIKIHVNETDAIVRLMDAVVILLEGGNAHDLTILFSKRYRSESPNDSRELDDEISIKSPEKKVTVPATAAITTGTESKSNGSEELMDEADKEQAMEAAKTDSDEKTDCIPTGGDVPNSVSTTTEVGESAESAVQSSGNIKRFDKKIDGQEPRALHKTFSIFLRNLHPNVLRSEIEALVRPYAGFLRLALQDPTPDRKFFRRGWVTYDRSVNIKEICWNLNNIRLHDCDIGAIVNRELTQRIRPVMVLANHKPVMRHDLKIAAKLVARFDKRHNLWNRDSDPGNDKETSVPVTVASNNPLSSNNPLLSNITEYLVEEGSYEEEALLGGNLNCNLELAMSGSDPNNIKIEIDEKLESVLDKLIFYLRFVHSFDYYSTTEYQIEDEMPHRCGILHVRGAHIHPDKALSQKEVEEYIRNFEFKAEQILNAVDTLTAEEARPLGHRQVDEAVEAFIADNTQEIAKDKWLCPLSGKKFKGPDFVQKHILNKHMDKVDQVRQNTQFFNNYLLDGRRPQLPEHPSNRPGASKSIGGVTESGEICGGRDAAGGHHQSTDGGGNRMYRNSGGDMMMDSRNRNNDGSNNNSRNMGGRRNDDFSDNRRNSYRSNNNDQGSSPGGGGGYRDYGNRNNNSGNFGDRGGAGGPNNNGTYYRKNNYNSRGNNQNRNQRNGGGSYYSRKVLSYNDLDAPADD